MAPKKDPRAWARKEIDKHYRKRGLIEPPRAFTPGEIRYLKIVSAMFLILLAWALVQWIFR